MKIIAELSTRLNEIYQAGILQFSVDAYNELKGKESIRKITGTSVTKIDTSNIFSEKTAYNSIHRNNFV